MIDSKGEDRPLERPDSAFPDAPESNSMDRQSPCGKGFPAAGRTARPVPPAVRHGFLDVHPGSAD
jgi:hypothetical protein